MIPAGAEYLAYEAQKLGATPAIRATFLPFLWPNGVDAGGTFVECAFVAPDRIQADYHGFSGGYWLSEVLVANLQIPTSPAVITWDYNYPGYDAVLYWRAAKDLTTLAAADWVVVNQGDTLNIAPFYQFKLTLEGYRCWACDTVGDADDGFLAYAEDDPGLIDDFQGYAADDHVTGDPLCYIEALALLGEFTVVGDIEEAGTVTQEAPVAFDDLVAGDHSGLLLSNRQGSMALVGGVPTWTPAPSYSPNKSSFIFAPQMAQYANEAEFWRQAAIKLRIELGWSKGGFLATPFLEEGGMFEESFTEFLTLFLGKVARWGPVQRAVDENGQWQPNTCEIYAKDFICEALQKRVALPAYDGTPQPLTYGEYLAKAETVSGWSPAPLIRSAYFEGNNYNELDHVISLGGGAFSLITPGLSGLVGSRAFRAATTGANQSAYGSLILPHSGEMFVRGTVRFKVAPDTISDLNMTFLQIIDATGAVDFSVSVDKDGAIYASLGGQSKFNIKGFVDVPLAFALWVNPASPGYAKLWINGDEVLTDTIILAGASPLEFRFGCDTAGVAESWTIDFDDLEVRGKYYDKAYRVTGAPFAGIGPVYVDNVAQPDSKTVETFVQTLTRYPEHGMVQITSTDPDFNLSGEVMFRLIEKAGGRHPLYVLEELIAQAGLTAYLDATALAAAYAAVPKDICGARFEGGSDPTDIASLGVTVADCIKEVCSRFLYWIFIDAGQIKIVPYTGTAPSGPVMAFAAANLQECDQQIDMENLNAWVSVNYGWCSRNPSLSYLAGDATAGGQGTGLDFTWGGAVACESYDVVKAKADLLLKFLSAQERLDPIKTTLAGARLELVDPISVNDTLLHDSTRNYLVSRKVINLDSPRGTEIQALRFLGE